MYPTPRWPGFHLILDLEVGLAELLRFRFFGAGGWLRGVLGAGGGLLRKAGRDLGRDVLQREGEKTEKEGSFS